MTNKTRKRIWPVSLVMSLALVGVVAAFVAMSVAGSQPAQAHGPCDFATMTGAEFAQCVATGGDDPHTHPEPEPSPSPTPDPMPMVVHASMPYEFWLEGLDNGARLSWGKPMMVGEKGKDAMVVGYRIHRDAWHPEPNHPINMYGSYDATIDVYPENVLAASYSDRGLAYDTVYSYSVQAVVEYNIAGWWRQLNCVKMNDVVDKYGNPTGDEPAVGADDATSPYCEMEYDDLSAAAMPVVSRAYNALEMEEPAKYIAKSYYRYALGEMSMMRSIETATSGGLLDALIAPPSPPRNVMTEASCNDRIMVTWDAPENNGKVPAADPAAGCPICTNRTPNHIGGNDAGIEIQPGIAEITGYMVERKAGASAWETVAIDVTTMYYVDTDDLMYGYTYYYRVSAMNQAMLYSDPSMPGVEMLTAPEAAQVPTSPDADPSPDNPAHVLFTWDPPGTAAGNAAWRDVDDVGANNMSESMSYEIQRQRVGTTTWMTLPMADATQRHQYLESAATAAEAIDNIQTQEFVDENVPATGAYKYRVRAIIDLCEPSEWAVTAEEVTVTLELGNASGLSASASSVPGIVNLSWTAAPNANVHWLAGIKQADWDAGDYSNITWTQTSGMNSHVVTGLDSGDEYVFTVIGGSGINGPWSSWTALMRVTPN